MTQIIHPVCVTVDMEIYDLDLLRKLYPTLHSSVGLKIHLGTILRWEFPKERFCSYGPEDESWCRFFGIGREVEVDEAIEIPQCRIESVDPSLKTVTFQAKSVTLHNECPSPAYSYEHSSRV